jgi:hypothetical protein
MGSVGGSETSLWNCHYTLRNIPKERRSEEKELFAGYILNNNCIKVSDNKIFYGFN